MSTTIEIKYFNSFWLKKLENITQVSSLSYGGNITTIEHALSSNVTTGIVLLYFAGNLNDIFVNQTISFKISAITYTSLVSNITYNSGTNLTCVTINQAFAITVSTGQLITFNGVVANSMQTQAISPINTNTLYLRSIPLNIGIGQSVKYKLPGEDVVTNIVKYINNTTTVILENPIPVQIPINTLITFGTITNLTTIPSKYAQSTNSPSADWTVEEARIKGGYNNATVDFGVRAYLVEDSLNRLYLPSTLIYSGIYNSRTGINDTNQFSIGEDITKAVNISEGSIQKLYAEDTNLTIFQEKKVSRALIDKNAIYSTEGTPVSTLSNVVIGAIQAYSGNYGIGKNPESFAVYGYRKYFTDAPQNVVLRLSQDGITEISDYGMTSYFRNTFSTIGTKEGFIIGMFDTHSGQYVLSIQGDRSNNFIPSTLAFDDDTNGWVSRFSYIPDSGCSLNNDFYTFKYGSTYKHYSKTTGNANFYGNSNKSTVTLVFNPNVSTSKSFLTVNYEGTSSWNLTSYYTDTDVSVPISSYYLPTSSNDLENQLFSNNFKRKENKFFGNILNITSVQGGEVNYGQSISGIKGFFATATFSTDNSTIVSTNTSSSELYAVSSEYIESSY